MAERIGEVKIQIAVAPSYDWMEGDDPVVEVEQREELVQMLIEEARAAFKA